MEDAGFLGIDHASGEDSFYSTMEVQACACKICGTATINTATKLCGPCWEIQSRIDTYLKHPAGYDDIVLRVVKARLLKKDKTHAKN